MNRRSFFRWLTSVIAATFIRLPVPPKSSGVVNIPYLVDQPIGVTPMFGVITISKELLDDAVFDLGKFILAKTEAVEAGWQTIHLHSDAD
jgi:hypothetical protein